MSKWIRKHLCIVGRVQGVGFRHFTNQQAKKMSIVGYVKNMPNGTVEVDAVGLDEDVVQFINKLKQGPSMSHVQEIQEQILPIQKIPESFEIHYF